MDSRELSTWLAYDQVDGLEDPYWIGGMLASVIANMMGSGKRTFEPADFIPRKRESPRILSGDAGKTFFKHVDVSQRVTANNGQGTTDH